MKTINLAAMMIALVLSTGGFEAINFLFTHVAGGHERVSAELALRA